MLGMLQEMRERNAKKREMRERGGGEERERERKNVLTSTYISFSYSLHKFVFCPNIRIC